MEDRPIYIKEFYTLEQLSEELNLTPRALKEEIASGKLRAAKIRKKHIIQREDIKAWLDRNTAEQEQGRK